MPVTFIKAIPEGPVQDAASQMEPMLRAAFLAAVDATKGTIAEDDLAKALETGDVNRVLAVLALDKNMVAALNGTGIPDGVESLRSALQATAVSGGIAAVDALPSRVSVGLSFDLKSLDAQSFLEGYAFPLIREISDNTREGIRGVVLDAFKEGGHPFEQARRIRDMIGLTANQNDAVMNYRAALMDTGSALRDSLTRSLRDGRFDPTILRAARNNASLTQIQVDKMTGRYYERFINYRAKNIARTESLRASNQGQRAAWGQAVKQGYLPKDQEREWEVSGDEATCPICSALDGEVRGLDEEFDDGIMDPPDPHPSCLLGSTPATAKDIVGISERQYDGVIVVIRTASGKEISCTPNHPVLTDRGWCAAGFLDIGNDVVSCIGYPVGIEHGQHTRVGVDMHHQDVPIAIEHIADAFRRSSHVLRHPVPIAAEDFHGDGMRGDIAVVYAKRLLGYERESALRKLFVDRGLVSALPVPVGFLRQRGFIFGVGAYFRAAYSIMRGLSPAFALSGAGLFHAQEHGLASSTWLNTFVDKSGAYTVARDREVLSEPKHRPPGSVLLDRVVYRDVCSFSGQVFNIQTASQEYEANGIITHNCRCTTKLVFARAA
jgi:hypothetical protein